MRKILLRVFLVLLVFVAVVGGTAYFLLFRDTGEEVPVTKQPTMVDSSGDSHLVVVDNNGTSYAVVTDPDGNRYAAEFNGSEIGPTVGQINDQVAVSDLPTKPTGEQVVVTNNPDAYKGEVETIAPTTSVSALQTTTAPKATTESTSATDSVTEPAGTTAAVTEPTTVPAETTTVPAENNGSELVAYRIEKYEKIFASGTYLMEMTTNDADLGDTPITMAIKNGDMYIDTTIEGMKCKMLYISSSDTMYIIFDDWKKYCKLPEDLLGEDMDMSSMMAEFGMSDIGEVTVSEADINGQKLILESYISSVDGSTVNYYFDGENLVRRDNVSLSGTVDSIYISKFLSDVPDSYFEIPKGYGYLNLDWLGAFA